MACTASIRSFTRRVTVMSTNFAFKGRWSVSWLRLHIFRREDDFTGYVMENGEQIGTKAMIPRSLSFYTASSIQIVRLVSHFSVG
jgi:hypothetical protein